MVRLLALAYLFAASLLGKTDWIGTGTSVLTFWWISLAVGITVYGLIWLKVDRLHGWLKIFHYFLLGVAAVSLGVIVCHEQDQQLQQRLAQRIVHVQKVEGIVYVSQLNEGQVENWRQPVQLLIPQQMRPIAAASNPLVKRTLKSSINLLVYPKHLYDADGKPLQQSIPPFQLGQYYRVVLMLKPPHGLVNPGSFDQEKWLLENNIQGTATVLYSEPIAKAELDRTIYQDFMLQQQHVLAKWRLWIEQQRLAYRQAILQLSDQSVLKSSNDSSTSRGLLLGLLSGDRSGLDKDTLQLYQVMGISHLLAISGPQVVLLATLIVWAVIQVAHALMRRGYGRHLYLYCPKQMLYLPLFWVIVTGYAAFTGFEIPAMRTWMMVSICILALGLRINIRPTTTVLLAAVGVLVWDCYAILSAGFWLSFGAVAVLMLIYHQLPQFYDASLSDQPSLVARARTALRLLWHSQWRISLALMPIVLWQFQAVSMIAPVINMVAISFLGALIAPINLLAAIIWLVAKPIAQMVWGVLALLIDGFNAVLLALAPIGQALYFPSYFNDIALWALTVCLMVLSIPSGLIPKWWAAVFACFAFVPHQRSQLQVDVLDVGQGQSIVIQTPHHQMMVDTGAAAWQQGQQSMGDRVGVPFLRSQGIRELDQILLSHLDSDHSGGTAAIIHQIHTQRLRSNELAQFPSVSTSPPFTLCSQGQTWQWDNTTFEILSPRPDQDRKNQNEASCVLLVTTPMLGRTFRLLIMGDAGWEAEYYIVQNYPDLKVDIIVLGHHGSRHSSAYDFLAQIEPKLAIISAGFDNRYGHPTPQTLARLQDLNIPVVTTADFGNVHIKLPHAQALWKWQGMRQSRQWWLPKLKPETQGRSIGLYGSRLNRSD